MTELRKKTLVFLLTIEAELITILAFRKLPLIQQIKLSATDKQVRQIASRHILASISDIKRELDLITANLNDLLKESIEPIQNLVK